MVIVVWEIDAYIVAGYINMDDFQSRLRSLCTDREMLLRAL